MAIGPIGCQTQFVVPLKRRGVVLPLVAEEFPEFIVLRRVCDETVPIIVADFVAEMPEKCAVGGPMPAGDDGVFSVLCFTEFSYLSSSGM